MWIFYLCLSLQKRNYNSALKWFAGLKKKVNLIQHFWNTCILKEDTFLSKWWSEK